MLSTEKHPTDPSCLGDDERPYDKLKPLAVDLSTSHFAKGPIFSIRDYVFFSRNKNVVNNWPFSENNMQLCLKHGVKDLLPPFQSPDLVRNQGNVENAVVDKENRRDSIREEEPSDSNNHFKLVKSNSSSCDPDLVNPSVSEADKEHRLTTTTTKTASKKLAVKKCRVIMKYSNIRHSSTKEATTVNAPMSCEAVAVCPVCRTFSSSSNTTLNAHIDQCLSGEYTAKAASESDSKTNTRQIRRKPRKIKLMVEIYKTAPHCTLEELDRRNGSNWASSNRTFSPPEVEKKLISADPKPKGLCLNYAKEMVHGDDGSVYVDSNGRKLRILSKFSNPMDSKVVDNTPQQPRKLLKKGERSMGLLAKKIKKMRKQIKMQQKCLRLDNHGKKISNGQDEKNVEKDECTVKLHKLTETAKGWVRSEKTQVKKKINSAGDKHGLSSSLTNSHVKKLSDLKYPNANRAGKSGQNDNSSHKVHDESRGNPEKSCHGRKRPLEENAPSPDKRLFKIRKKPHARNDYNLVSNLKSSSSHHALLQPKSKKFSSLSKKLSWAVPDSRFSPNRKFSFIKKKVFIASDDEETTSHSGTDQSRDFSHEVTEEEEDSKYGDTSSEEEEPYDRNVLKSSQSTSMDSHHDLDSWNENGLMVSSSVARHTCSDNVEQQLSEEVGGGQFTTRFSNSMEAGYLGFEEYKLPLYEAEVATNLTEPVLISGQDMFGSDLIPEAMRIENVCMMVDQIPIPGPPGSFLPSPRHMDSDDLQGHSSLTSTRVQSHDDQNHDFADRCSESHASDTSSVSNSNTRRSASEPSQKLSVVDIAPSTEVDLSRSSTIVANVTETKTTTTSCLPHKTKLNNALSEMPSPNHHPCRCSRKEVLLKNDEDSPLLQRRTRMGGEPNSNSSSSCFSLRLAVQVEDGGSKGMVCEESVSPAPSTPVLRLMGKNLMVMNMDENDKPFDHLKHSMSNPQMTSFPRMFDRAPKVVGNYKHYSDTSHQGGASHYTPGGLSRNTSPCYETEEYMWGRAGLVDTSGFVHNLNGANKEGVPVKWSEEYVYGRPVRSLVDSRGLVEQHHRNRNPNGANNEAGVKWSEEYVYGRGVRSSVLDHQWDPKGANE